MILNLHPQCANPSCAAAFAWMAGGRLFRFPKIFGENASACDSWNNGTGLRTGGHFWLCEHHSKFYALCNDRKQGIVIQPLWPELQAARNHMPLHAS